MKNPSVFFLSMRLRFENKEKALVYAVRCGHPDALHNLLAFWVEKRSWFQKCAAVRVLDGSFSA